MARWAFITLEKSGKYDKVKDEDHEDSFRRVKKGKYTLGTLHPIDDGSKRKVQDYFVKDNSTKRKRIKDDMKYIICKRFRGSEGILKGKEGEEVAPGLVRVDGEYYQVCENFLYNTEWLKPSIALECS